jgi:hypothetical protein
MRLMSSVSAPHVPAHARVRLRTDRPSISTSSLLANCWLKPRMSPPYAARDAGDLDTRRHAQHLGQRRRERRMSR